LALKFFASSVLLSIKKRGLIDNCLRRTRPYEVDENQSSAVQGASD
jgi:hypothetical protein